MHSITEVEMEIKEENRDADNCHLTPSLMVLILSGLQPRTDYTKTMGETSVSSFQIKRESLYVIYGATSD